MTDHDRAVAWLDAHPEVVEAAALAMMNRLLEEPEREGTYIYQADSRAALLAFLTSPLPCAFCLGTNEVGGPSGADPQGKVRPCPDCTDGTVGIRLDQLERGTSR